MLLSIVIYTAVLLISFALLNSLGVPVPAWVVGVAAGVGVAAVVVAHQRGL